MSDNTTREKILERMARAIAGNIAQSADLWKDFMPAAEAALGSIYAQGYQILRCEVIPDPADETDIDE